MRCGRVSWWPLAVVAALLVSAALLAVPFAGSRRALSDRAELTLFPKGTWVRPLAAGFDRFAADLCWLEGIQYYGRHRQTDHDYRYAETLFRTMTTLDPQFEEAYVFGALILDGHKPAAALELLRDGIRRNPESWRLCFEYGFLQFLHEKGSAQGAEYLALASRMPGAPPNVARLAAYAAGKAGRKELAIEMWREMLRSSDNEEVRRIARRYLEELGVGEETGAGTGTGARTGAGTARPSQG